MTTLPHDVVAQIPRPLFASSAQNAGLVSGHSMPTQTAVQRILQLLPEITPQQRLMHIGAGTGYLLKITAKGPQSDAQPQHAPEGGPGEARSASRPLSAAQA